MDKNTASAMAEMELNRIRTEEYAALLQRIGNTECKVVPQPDGGELQVEIEVFWDDVKKRHLRVIVAVDDGGWRAFLPFTRSTIIGPEGEV